MTSLRLYSANMTLTVDLRMDAFREPPGTSSLIFPWFSTGAVSTPGYFAVVQEESGRMTTKWGLENKIGFKLLPMFFQV